MTELLKVSQLQKYFQIGKGLLSFREKNRFVRAVDDVTMSVREGETFGLVGESGCGKTTTAKLILKLLEPTCGTIQFMGHDISRLSREELMRIRRQLQMIFQDPYASLNPRKTVRHILRKPFLLHNVLKGDEADERVKELLEEVGLSPASAYFNRYPHEFSGGQRQRIGIARAIALKPKLVIADEPVSALDMSVRAQVLNLLKQVKHEFGLTYIIVTHDLAVVRSVCTRVAVMYLGKIVEIANVEELYENPLHPYTKAILNATPIPNPRLARSSKRTILMGDVPSPIDPPTGCHFHPRCSQILSNCMKEEPCLIDIGNDHLVSCHLYTR